jgi:hypothetical protein
MSSRLLCTLPFDEGEVVAEMICWKDLVCLYTSLNRLFLLRLSDKTEIAGPVEFIPAEMRNKVIGR